MFTSLLLAAVMSVPPEPGTIVLAGGGKTNPKVVARFIQAIGGPEKKVIVLGYSSVDAQKSADGSAEFLKENGAKNVIAMGDAPGPTMAKKLTQLVLNADGVWMPGGDQKRFIAALGAQFAQKLFRQALANGVCFFGTSAGAMVLSNPMIGGMTEDNLPLQSEGIGLVPFLVDTHYRNRDRQPRLKYAMEHFPAAKAVGISEGEWVVIREGKLIESEGQPEWLTR